MKQKTARILLNYETSKKKMIKEVLEICWTNGHSNRNTTKLNENDEHRFSISFSTFCSPEGYRVGHRLLWCARN